jgi:Transposase DDE domain
MSAVSAMMSGMAENHGSMHVAKIRRRHGDREYVSHLVRRSVRDGKRVRHETIANISKLPADAIETLTLALRGVRLLAAGEAFAITRSLPHGHVEAVLGAARRLGLERLLDREPSPERDLCMAMILARVLSPGSKLATVRSLGRSTLASELGVEGCDQDDLYAAMDWLSGRQERIEQRLARRHLAEGEPVLYDVSSSYFEGRACPLAKLGYSRDGKRGTLQVIYGLLCDHDGRPVAVECFDGSLHDDKTLGAQIAKLKTRFQISRVTVVIDRGFATKANVQLLSETDGVAWITALKAPQVKKLVKDGVLQLSLFDEHNLAEIACEQLYPGERLVVCRNPLVAAERTRKRDSLLDATERTLSEIAERVRNKTLAGEAEIGLAVGAVWNRYKVKKHFELQITDQQFTFSRKTEQINFEASLDGIYVLRSGGLSHDQLAAPGVVRAYKQLKEAEKGFGTIKGLLEVRPIHHHLEDRVRAHLLICMLAYYLTWHLRAAWTELLFADPHPAQTVDPVAKASRSPTAEHKAQTKRTPAGQPCHSLKSLLSELATRSRNTINPAGTDATFDQHTEPTQLQARALALINEHTPKTT